MIQHSKALVLVIVSFLIVILIHNSIAQLGVFGLKPKPTSRYTCYASTPTEPGAARAQTCCHTDYDKNGNQVGSTVCVKCQYDSNGDPTSNCTTFYPRTVQTGPINPPPSAGSALPPSGNNTGTPGKTSTGTLPPVSVIKVPPLTTTQTCPDGSQPDSSGKCPTSNPNTSSPSPSSNNNNPPANNPQPSGGSSNGNGGGSGSSGKNNGGGSSISGTSSPSKLQK
jgi:uncharacterized membrane protein YgcG